MSVHWLPRARLERLHAKMIRREGGIPELHSPHLLESALARAQSKQAYADPEPTLPELAAAYAFGIAKNHPFADGNKRAGLLAVHAFLFLNDLDFAPNDDEAVSAMVDLANDRLDEAGLAEWIARNTKPLAES